MFSSYCSLYLRNYVDKSKFGPIYNYVGEFWLYTVWVSTLFCVYLQIRAVQFLIHKTSACLHICLYISSRLHVFSRVPLISLAMRPFTKSKSPSTPCVLVAFFLFLFSARRVERCTPKRPGIVLRRLTSRQAIRAATSCKHATSLVQGIGRWTTPAYWFALLNYLCTVLIFQSCESIFIRSLVMYKEAIHRNLHPLHGMISI